MRPINLTFVIFLIVSPVLVIGLLHRCPPKANLQPFCSCKSDTRFHDVEIICQDIKLAFHLQDILKYLQNYVVDRLIVRNSGVFEFASGTFAKLTIHKVTFEKVEFSTLPMFTFLNGLEESIEELQFLNCKISQWLWHKGTHFSFMQSIQFQSTNLPKVITSHNFTRIFPNNIQHLKLRATGIKQLGQDAIRKFGRLERLELEENALTTYDRNSFPLPAKRLIYLSLTKNPLRSLPENAFVQMRRLEFLSLAATQLTSLHENTFKPVWEQLEEVYFNNIILNCNCNSTWLLDVSSKRVYKAPMCMGINGKNKPMNEIKHLEICSHGL